MIPYAPWNPDDDYRSCTCPACGERIPEEFDCDGEQTTHNYATHYTRAHESFELRARQDRETRAHAAHGAGGITHGSTDGDAAP